MTQFNIMEVFKDPKGEKTRRAKVIPFIKTVFVLGALSSAAYIQDFKSMVTNTIYFSEQVGDESIVSTLDQVRKTNEIIIPFERTTVVLNTPGGSLSSYNLYESEVQVSKVPVDTYIPMFAASAGAMMFMSGERRTMKDGAKVLFHEPRVFLGGVLVLTFTDLFSIVEEGKFPDSTSEDNKRAVVQLQESGQLDMLISKLYEIFKPEIPEMRKLLNDMISYLALRLNKSEEFVTSHIIVANKDIILTAKEALDLGVSTETV